MIMAIMRMITMVVIGIKMKAIKNYFNFNISKLVYLEVAPSLSYHFIFMEV